MSVYRNDSKKQRLKIPENFFYAGSFFQNFSLKIITKGVNRIVAEK